MTPLEEAVRSFLTMWDRRSKYHYTDRELVAAVRVLREVIGDGWAQVVDGQTP